MKHTLKKTLLAVSVSLVIAPVVYATNGLAPTGVGQIHKAMGGAAVANPENTTSIATNPASVTAIPNGYDVELELFKPNRTVIRGTETYKGDEKPIFFIPGGGYKKSINNKISIGVSVYGNGGMNTEFKNSPTFSPDGVNIFTFSGPGEKNSGINLEQLFIAPTIGIKLNDKHSLGISANLVYQTFEANGIGSLAGSRGPDGFSGMGKASATGIGATVGWLGQLNDKFAVGASYRMKTKMGKFKEYARLFPDQGRMDIPAALTVGLSVMATPKTKIAFDIQQIYYSDTHAIGNSSSKPVPFGSTNGPGFGWDDQTVFKFGVKHQKSSKLSLMAGFNHGDSPVGPEDTFFGTLAPGVVEDHLSLGFEYKLSKTSKVLGSYTHTFSNKVEGVPFELEMDQDAVGIGYSKQF